MSSPFVAALDIGTSSVRASLFDCHGRAVQAMQSRTAYRMSTTGAGGVEIDPDSVVDIVCRSLDNLHRSVSEAMPAAELAAVAVSTFWHGVMGLDDRNRPATPLYSWNDTRSASAATRLLRRLDQADLHARTGCMIHASYWPARLTWLREEEPAVFSLVRRWISIGDYLYLRLFGSFDSSVSIASATGLFNQNECSWDETLLAELRLDPDRLPALANSNTGVVLSDRNLTSRWPLFADARWFPALGDGACGNAGSGCVTADRVAINIGTSGALRVLWEAQSVAIPPGLWCYRADRARFVMGGALSNAGDLFAWAQDQLRLPSDEELERRLGEVQPDSHGLTVLPFWSGERSTGWAAHARGAITGINLDTNSIEILRAILESVAFRFAAIFDLVAREFGKPSIIVASGAGAAESPAWAQILSDVLGSELLVPDYAEASSRGAALMALESLGLITGLNNSTVLSGKVFAPDSLRHQRYLEARQRQDRLYDSIIGR